ncbi:MAG: CotH kinase family protein [Lepagella sp.]
MATEVTATAQDAVTYAQSSPAPSGNPLTRIARKKLINMDMPLVEFTLKRGEFPNFNIVFAPEGCVGVSIINNEYVEGRLVVSRMNDTIYDSGNYVSKASGIRLKVRGNTSNHAGGGRKASKPGYKIKLSKKGKLIDYDEVGKSKDWVLKAVSLYNPGFAYEIGQLIAMGWQPKYQMVNVVVNNAYFGVYYLIEAVTGDSDRLDIEDSGYVIENDPYWWKPDEVYFQSKHIHPSMGWTFKEPDTDDFGDMTMINIQWAIAVLENALMTNDDVSKYLDLRSFASWLLVQDLIGIPDPAGCNMLVVKDDFDIDDPFATKIKMGPLWDLDSAPLTNDNDFARIHYTRIFYYPYLLAREDFYNEYKNIWNEHLPTLYRDYNKSIKKMLMRNPAYEEARAFEHEYNKVNYYPNFKDEVKLRQEWFYGRLRTMNYLINGTYELPEPPEDPGSIFDRPDPMGDNTLLDKDGGVIKFDLMGHPVKDNAPGITITRTTQTAKKQISQQ